MSRSTSAIDTTKKEEGIRCYYQDGLDSESGLLSASIVQCAKIINRGKPDSELDGWESWDCEGDFEWHTKGVRHKASLKRAAQFHEENDTRLPYSLLGKAALRKFFSFLSIVDFVAHIPPSVDSEVNASSIQLRPCQGFDGL